ncbi:hypothetical protein D3C85_730800 [compost metagenome]
MLVTNLENKGFTNFLLMNKIKIKNNKTISFVNDCQGVKCKASPKHPQSLTTSKYAE